MKIVLFSLKQLFIYIVPKSNLIGLILCLLFLLFIYFHCCDYIQTTIHKNVVVCCTLYPIILYVLSSILAL